MSFRGGKNMGEVWMYINEENGVTLYVNWYPSHDDTDKFIAVLEELKADKTPQEIDEYNRCLVERANSYEKGDVIQKDNSGYIYIFRSESLYEIGRSKRKDCRLKRYRTENPYQVEPILIIGIDNYIQEEVVVLGMFKSKRHQGEWFDLEQCDIDTIRAYLVDLGGEVMELPA